MFSGKTSTGRVLSQKTGFDFYDIDNLIEEKCSMSVSEVFEKLGESYFRETERLIVRELFGSGLKNAVVATGGGTICDRASFEIISERSLLVYLKLPYGEILKRKNEQPAGSIFKRPVAASANGEEFKKLFEGRSAVYEKAFLKIDCSGLNTGDAALQIIKMAEIERN